jgi:hypothetical protein
MSLCVYSVFMLSCGQVADLRRADPPSKESYRMCIGSRNWKSGQGPTKGCRATDERMNEWMNVTILQPLNFAVTVKVRISTMVAGFRQTSDRYAILILSYMFVITLMIFTKLSDYHNILSTAQSMCDIRNLLITYTG